MARILIASFAGDTHATAVAQALRIKGHEALLWMNTDFPTQDSLSLHLGSRDEDKTWILQTAQGRASLDTFTTVWYRRPSFGLLPDSMHPGDRTIAQKESEALLRGLWATLPTQGAFFVNHPRAAAEGLSKPLQLQIARSLGLAIPDTLFSNDPDTIRAFIDRHQEVIFKTFFTWQWQGAGQVASSYTARLNRNSLPSDRTLRLAPGIFQPLIPKSHELRVVICGERIVPYEIHSQARASAALDWRLETFNVPTRLGRLDASTEQACLALMKKLGLVFGCLDLIVTPQGETIFLEVNQMGQWLWLEEMVPEFPLLDMFAEFLAQGRPDFKWDPEYPDLRWNSMIDEILEEDRRLQTVHVPYPNSYLVSD